MGVGTSRRLGKTRLYASAEWHAPVDRFSVIAVPDDPRSRAASAETDEKRNSGRANGLD
jgi:hypothetical protein